jgi:hypothetical protein
MALFPPLFPLINASPAVKAIIGSNPVRFWQFGQNQDQPAQYPYAVWQRSSGEPENNLSAAPDMDGFTIQIDCYASGTNGATTVRNLAGAIRDAIEQPNAAHITSWLGESRDPETQAYRFTFLVDFFVPR